MDYAEFAFTQNRFRALKQVDPKVADELVAQAKKIAERRFALLEKLAQLEC
jgi:pyruvate-ferredoxin/flavodoxin oxidoreductase